VFCVFVLSFVLLQEPTAFEAVQNWPRIAEGWTAIDERSTVDVAYRKFSLPEMHDICNRTSTPARLIVKEVPARLRSGQWFDFSSLRIIGVDRAGHSGPPVPITLEVQETTPPLFSLARRHRVRRRDSGSHRHVQIPRQRSLPWHAGRNLHSCHRSERLTSGRLAIRAACFLEAEGGTAGMRMRVVSSCSWCSQFHSEYGVPSSAV
jgi:hypothetical protein